MTIFGFYKFLTNQKYGMCLSIEKMQYFFLISSKVFTVF